MLLLADLDEDLPCFKGSKSTKDDMILMAIAWGYKTMSSLRKYLLMALCFTW